MITKLHNYLSSIFVYNKSKLKHDGGKVCGEIMTRGEVVIQTIDGGGAWWQVNVMNLGFNCGMLFKICFSEFYNLWKLINSKVYYHILDSAIHAVLIITVLILDLLMINDMDVGRL